MVGSIFSNDWWAWVWNTYSMSILGFPAAITFLLKLIAIYNPRIKSNEVCDLINQYWPKSKKKEVGDA